MTYWPALWQAKVEKETKSWYCHPCAVEVYQLRCPHCGKTEQEKK